ncbi:MAG: NYN domain-containing protein [Chloroflexota bacterium]
MIDENRADAAVFFDFENIAYSLRLEFNENPNFEALMDKCQEYGRVVLARAYANWGRHTSVIAPLQASGFDPVYVPSYFYSNQEKTTRKNAVDIHLAIEAIETIHSRPHVSVYIILTGDKDFIPLANALRRHGKQVVALGVKGTTSPYLQQAVDDFIFYHQVLEDPGQRLSEENIYDVLARAIQQLQTQKDDTILPRIKHTMSELLNGFDEKKHKDAEGNHFRKFKDFIREAQRLGYVRLETTGTENRVYLAGEKAESKKPPKEKKEKRERKEKKEQERKRPSSSKKENKKENKKEKAALTIEMSLLESFDLLTQAVNQTKEANKSLRASHIKTVMRNLKPGFDEKQVVSEDGKKFTRFTEFARAAESQGAVKIVGKGMGTEIHPVGENGRSAPATQPEEPQDQPVVSPATPAEPTPTATQAEVPVVPPPTIQVETPAAPEEASAEQFFLDALRAFAYPAQIQPLLTHCSQVRDAHQREDLNNHQLRQLLAVAVQGGLLQRTTGEDPRQVYLVLDEGETAVMRFLQG